MHDLLWLLLPVAAFAGWFAAIRGKGSRQSRCPDTMLGAEYFRGLNHLLNERPDKAIDVFIRMLEVTADTFETHLALGSLFRRRGEVDRAICIHQNLVARETLSTEQRTEARLELARDYLRAGLLDRAEGLLNGLVGVPGNRVQVLAMLLDIYQQEKDWGRALAVAAQMEYVDGQPVDAVCAQFLCEQALQAIAAGNSGLAREYLARALATDERCARANIILGDMLRDAGDCQSALASYGRVEQQDIGRLPEVLEAMADCHRKAGSSRRMIDYLHEVIPRYNGIAPVLLQAELLNEEQGRAAAAEFLTRALDSRPSVRGLARLIDLGLAGCGNHDDVFLQGLGKLTDALQDNSSLYSCTRCGFAGKALYWQCPGCRCWDTLRPVHGVQGI
jgi:lipopolysaccharide biosynthesis regulator YciM